jgi:predicted TIM-barrel fold metal-dependent hydrolase
MINNMYVVNFHEHPRATALEENSQWGVDFTVLLTVGHSDALIGRQMAFENQEKCVSFHWVDLDNNINNEIHKLKIAVKKWGIKGVKFQPMDQHIYMNDKKTYPILEVCEELGLIVTWHAGVVDLEKSKYEFNVPILGKYCDPIYIDEVAVAFPDLNIVIAHLGGNYLYNATILASKHDNVYLDTAYLKFFAPRFFPPTTPSELIKHAVFVSGEDKILYGGEGVMPEDVLNADISEKAKEKILAGNAIKLLGLSSNSKQDKTNRNALGT